MSGRRCATVGGGRLVAYRGTAAGCCGIFFSVDAIVTEDEEVASGTAVLFIFVVILRSRGSVAAKIEHDNKKMGREERKGCVIDQAGKSVCSADTLITTTYPPHHDDSFRRQ